MSKKQFLGGNSIMAKKTFTPATPTGKFCTRKSNGQQVAIENVIKETKLRGGLVDNAQAENYIVNHYNQILKDFEIPEELKKEVFEATVAFGKKKITEGGFPKSTSAAEKKARASFGGASEDTSEKKSEEETTSETPADTTSAGDKPADETPADTTEGETSGDDSTATPDEETDETSDDADAGKKDEDKKKKKQKKSTKTSAWTVIICLALGLLIGFGSAFVILNAKNTADTETYEHGSVDANVAVYTCNQFLLSDYGAKGTITVCRNTDKVVGHKATLLMNSTIFTDESGYQWLKYTSATPDMSVEILAPVFPEGEDSARKDYDKNLERRNTQFGVVEVLWNDSQCVVTLTNARVSYELDLVS